MKNTVFEGPGKVSVKEFPMPEIQKPTDAVVKILRACVCGSDLWWFRGLDKRETGTAVGHEAIGIVESVGTAVTHVQPGDFVILPFTHGCGHCAACKAGFEGNCLNDKERGSSGFQGEYVRYTEADWSLVKIPGQPEDYTDEQLNDLLALSDVMATGYHAAASAEVHPGDTVVVMGDGAVGLCGVIAAKLMGATRIIAMSRHADRQAMAREFGATDIVEERGDEAAVKVLAMTSGGADAVLECVGTALPVDTAIKVARPGAVVGRVGVPQEATNANATPFWTNVGLRGGIASVTTYDRNVLLDAVLQGKIHPGHVFTQRFDLADVQSAYEAMDKREAIKSLLIVSK